MTAKMTSGIFWGVADFKIKPGITEPNPSYTKITPGQIQKGI